MIIHSMEEAVEEVIRLDKDDAAYLDKMMHSLLALWC